MLNDIIGANIRRLRLQGNLTQEKLADILCVSHQMISKYENGSTAPDIDILVKLSGLFKISVDAICGTEDSCREKHIHELIQKYTVVKCSKHSDLQEIYQAFLKESDDYRTDDRILNVELTLLSALHDSIENEIQHKDINAKLFVCAQWILDISKDDLLRSFANYRMALYYTETDFASKDYRNNLRLAHMYIERILLKTYFPDYTTSIGLDIRSEEYRQVQENNIQFFTKGRYNAIMNLARYYKSVGNEDEYNRLIGIAGKTDM